MTPHPQYSPDLVFSDFFLFGHLKNRLQGKQFRSAYDLLSAVQEILDEIGVDTLEAIFWEWINRLGKCITVNGKYM
jgi:hypothetical protein